RAWLLPFRKSFAVVAIALAPRLDICHYYISSFWDVSRSPSERFQGPRLPPPRRRVPASPDHGIERRPAALQSVRLVRSCTCAHSCRSSSPGFLRLILRAPPQGTRPSSAPA